LATGSGMNLYVWKTDNGQAAFAPLKHPRPVSYAAFSPDGSRLVTCCSDSQIHKCFAQVWDTVTGRPIGVPLNHADGVLFASFSPDGRRIVTASEDFTAAIWDAAAGTQLVQPLRHEDKVQTATFSSDGKWIVTASTDKTARVWNAETGDPLTPPLRNLAYLKSAKFLTGDSRMAVSDQAGNAWTWNLPLVEMPVEDAVKLAFLLSGNAISSAQSSPPQSDSPQAIWQRLQAEYPSDFTTSPQEITAWYEFEAEKSEAEHEWFAATFYLKQLLSIQPDDKSLIERFAQARQNLGK
jgi:WD40 repeat protein